MRACTCHAHARRSVSAHDGQLHRRTDWAGHSARKPPWIAAPHPHTPCACVSAKIGVPWVQTGLCVPRPPPNLVRMGMFTGHPRHMWVAVLGPFVWDASRGSQRYRGGVRRCAHRPPLVCAAGAAPPHTRDLGVTYCRARTMEAQEAPGGSNRRELGWFCRRHFDRPGPIYL